MMDSWGGICLSEWTSYVGRGVVAGTYMDVRSLTVSSGVEGVGVVGVGGWGFGREEYVK